MPNTPPVIDSITPAGPITANVGTVVSVQVVAHDVDARTETFDVVPVNVLSGVRGAKQSLQLVWTDPITYEVTGPAGSPTVVNVQPNGIITFVG